MPDLSVRVAREDEMEAAIALRCVVFVEGQNVPLHEEVDGLDPDCVHIVAYSEGTLVGTARLLRKPTYAKAQRVAVSASARKRGVGAAVMQVLEQTASKMGFTAVRLDAQCVAISFYEGIGYVAEGPVFLDANIEHRAMHKAL